jgi:5'-phosphate synthase pdxT subunit
VSDPVRIGVLAIQGDIEAHFAALERIGARPKRVLREKQLGDLDGLVIPGGESTTISKGLTRLGLWEPLREFCLSGRSVLGTCAGAILLARESANHPVPTLGSMDFAATRNAYGTQLDSFAAPVDAGGPRDLENLRCVFIRAPGFEALGPDIEVLARVEGAPVLLRQGALIACAFHPELTQDSRVHELLVDASRDA